MNLATRTGLFGIYSCCVILVHLQALQAWVELSRNDSSASHLILIPVITLVLVYQNRASVFSAVRFAWGGGLTVILLGLLLFVAKLYAPFASQTESLTFVVAAFVMLFLGGFLLFYGQRAFRAALFPLLFLAFMIPIPDLVLHGVTRALTTGSSEVVAALFTLTGTPYHRQGFIFSLPTVAIYIADECSGIRSTIALILTALLAGHTYLRRGWSKALFAAAILPITILKNGIRITTLTLLAIYVDPGYLTGRLHNAGGVVFFLLAMVIAVPLFVFLYKRDNHGQEAGAGPQIAPLPARQVQ